MPRNTCHSQLTLPAAPPTSTGATCATARSSRKTTPPPACIAFSRQLTHQAREAGKRPRQLPENGHGKRLFADHGDKVPLKLINSAAFETGVLNLTYTRA